MTDYKALADELAAISEGVDYPVSVLSNTSAFLFTALSDLNWCGFYLYEDGKLILGPFQGKLACTEIEIGRGVCGTAAEIGKTVLVPNVHEFEGHIPCDGASNSEIVIPIFVSEKLFGVLDIDSPLYGRFRKDDKDGLESCVGVLGSVLENIVLKRCTE